MAATESVLTLALIEAISIRIRGGAFEQVAVEAMGVSWPTYQAWQRLAEQQDCPDVYRVLNGEVRQAIAWARLKAEMELHDKDAKTWLLHGPGREGWGSAGKSRDSAEVADRTSLLELCAALLEALTPFPDARAAAAAALDHLERSSGG